MSKTADRGNDVATFYDWLSRFTQASAFARGRRHAGLAVHKTLRVPPELAGAYRGEEAFYIDDRAFDAANLSAEPRVLDAGCGFGGTIFRWHERIGGQYDGLTLSPVQRRVAEREAARRGLAAQCQFHLRSYDEPVADRYDAVIAIESLIHSPDFHRSFAILAAALAPGGKLVIADDIPPRDLGEDEDARRVRRDWNITAIPSAWMYRQAIKSARLRLVHLADYTDYVVARPLAGLRRRERLYRALRFVLPLAGARSVATAFLGGLALERLYLRRRVRYRLMVLRKDV